MLTIILPQVSVVMQQPQLQYSGFISLGANFPEWSVLSLSRNFPDLEIDGPYS